MHDKDTLEAIKKALAQEYITIEQAEMYPVWLRYLLQHNEQQQAENRMLKDKVNQLRGDRDNREEECEEYRLQLQQSREEAERLRGELEGALEHLGAYRKVLEWYAGGNEDDGLKAESILSRYTPKERGDNQ